MGRISSFIFLLGLALTAALLPKYLRLIERNLTSSKPPTSLPQSFQETDSEEVFVFEPESIPEELLANLDEDSRQFVMENATKYQVKMNPLLGKLLKQRRSPDEVGKKSFSIQACLLWFEQNKSKFGRWILYIPGALLLFGLGFMLMGFKSQGRSCFSFCHFFGHMWLMFLSIFTVFIFIGTNINLWEFLSWKVWSGPILSILISAGLLHTIDMNVPIWNSTVRSFFPPIVAVLAIFLWDKISGLI